MECSVVPPRPILVFTLFRPFVSNKTAKIFIINDDNKLKHILSYILIFNEKYHLKKPLVNLNILFTLF